MLINMSALYNIQASAPREDIDVSLILRKEHGTNAQQYNINIHIIEMRSLTQLKFDGLYCEEVLQFSLN